MLVALLETRLRVRHPCPYCDVSVAFPRSLLFLWGENRRDIFLVASPDLDELRDLRRAFSAGFRARCLHEDGTNALLSVPDFSWSDPPSVTRLAEEAGAWVAPPVQYFAGWETYRLLSSSRAGVKTLVRRLRSLGDVELLSTHGRASLDPAREASSGAWRLVDGLTDLQARALVRGWEAGLFSVPSTGRWEFAARQMGLSRSTYGEHLRKGQRRLLENVYSALKSRASIEGAPVLMPQVGVARRKTRAPLRGIRGPPPAERPRT